MTLISVYYTRDRDRSQTLQKTIYKEKAKWYNFCVMKKVIEVEGMCCKRCAERAEKKLLLLDGVKGAKANFKKGVVFIETELSDEALTGCVTEAGFTVKEIRIRKGIFG